jgi:hydroxyacylglutathione hydrolase
MKWFQLPLGPIQTNAYIITNESNQCLIVDPGGEGARLINWLKKKSLTPLAILLTHAHFDHIGAVDEAVNKWRIPLYLHENEKDWLQKPELNGSLKFGMSTTAKQADFLFSNEQVLHVGPYQLQVLETPGHSPGSVSFYFKDAGIVFSGDALFAGSIGRTDLRGGSQSILLQSIHTKLMTLPEETVVAPGHGPDTTIQNEMDSNPFLNGF